MRKLTTLNLVFLISLLFGNASAQQLTIIAPNGGEVFDAGSEIAIHYQFDQSAAGMATEQFIFHVSLDGGLTESYIGDHMMTYVLPAGVFDSTFLWTPSVSVNSNQCSFYVFRGGFGPMGSDTTDAFFSILPPAKQVTVVSPNGGENLIAGTNESISYTYENGDAGDNLIFSYSADGGVNYTILGDTTLPAIPSVYLGSFNFTVPDTASTNCLIAITRGGFGPMGSDTSDLVFSISEGISTNSQMMEEINIDIYPNPSTGLYYLQTEALIDKIYLFSLEGKLLKQYTTHTKIINLSSYPAGEYILKIVTEDKFAVRKVTKN